jgi:hypothetical protein
MTYRCLGETQQEPANNEACVRFHEGGACADNGPNEHAHAHIDARPNSSDQHVAGNLHQNVSNEEDGYCRVEISPLPAAQKVSSS